MSDLLTGTDLELWTPIGVSDAERVAEQRVLVSFSLSLPLQGAAEADDCALSVDYALLAEGLKKLASKERKTIERLAEDCASFLLRHSPATTVDVIVKKFPPIGAKEVSVTVERAQ
jgi:FolB domain-containing protein